MTPLLSPILPRTCLKILTFPGLGLSLVQKIVLAHNGRIEVQDINSGGTRFIVTLPTS